MWRTLPPGTIVPDPGGCTCGLLSVRPDGGSAVWVVDRELVRRRTDEDDAALRRLREADPPPVRR